ncbi:hypothetical protein L2E82_15200 [Cichorium intybus]|uniref:Uncharacterized protein n=1 Tax=Cichorium intybus TaxID=13427 RepID=A0ACB9F1H4_CICIN|nr:hypothetical protein L2E82_15200 [Cichorium intybus]
MPTNDLRGQCALRLSSPTDLQPEKCLQTGHARQCTSCYKDVPIKRLHVEVRAKRLLSSGKCSSIIYSSFKDKADVGGHKWTSLAEETKKMYWEEFQKKCYWDVAIHDSRNMFMNFLRLDVRT